MKTIGTQIKNLRESKGLNQADFAKLLDLSQAQVSRIESGLSNPSLDLIKKIQAKFNIKLEL